ncbi:MAG: hypothetical protein ACAI38_18950 [Myxococcota bacterium]|nr:hypothetical protein [Myxococcota bacterium]
MRRVALFAVLASACGTYRFQHGPEDQDELVTCPPCALPEVCDESRHVCSTATLTWEELGGSATGSGVSGTGAQDVAVAVTAEGNPVVAWSAGDEIFASRWTGAAWEQLGSGVSLSAAVSEEPAIAIDGVGRVLVAWTEGSDMAKDIYLRRWDGSAWQELDGSAQGAGISGIGLTSMQPQLAVTPSDEPVVAWLEDTGPTAWEIYARRFDGADWREYDGSAQGDGLSKASVTAWNPSLAVRDSGNPCVAWSAGDTTVDMRLRCWNGTTWLALGPSADPGGISPTTSHAFNSSLAIDGLGRAWVSWRGNAEGRWEAYLRYFENGAWRELAGSAQVSGDIAASDHVKLAMSSSDRPVVAWLQDTGVGRTVAMRFWTGDEWVDLAEPGNEISAVGSIDVMKVAVASGGSVIATWIDGARVYLKRLR